MADFVKLNGYNVKDQTARQELVNINNNLNNQLYSSCDVAEIGHFAYTNNLQGGFMYNNMFYTYDCYTNDLSGDFNIINMETGQLTQILNCNFGHGNDFAVVNGYVYCAPYSIGGSSNKSTKLLMAPLANLASVTEYDDIVIDDLDCLYGVTKLDDEHLILAIRNQDYNVKSTRLFKYNIANKTHEEYTINWNGFETGSSFPHPIDFKDNKLIITASAPEAVMSFNLSDNTFTLNKIDHLPKYSPFGMALQEIESIGRCERFGLNYIIIAIRSYQGAHIVAYNTKGSAPLSLVENIELVTFTATNIYVNHEAVNVFETGSSSYPFKSLERAQYFRHLTPQTVIIHSSGDAGNVNITETGIIIELNHNISNLYVTGGADVMIYQASSGTKKISSIRLGYFSRVYASYIIFDTVQVFGHSTLRTLLTKINTSVSVINEGGTVDLSLPGDNPNISISTLGNALVKVNLPSKFANPSFGGGTTVLVPGRMAVQS